MPQRTHTVQRRPNTTPVIQCFSAQPATDLPAAEPLAAPRTSHSLSDITLATNTQAPDLNPLPAYGCTPAQWASDIAAPVPAPMVVQASLMVSAPTDQYEHEAERMADLVMQHEPLATPAGAAAPAIQRAQLSSIGSGAGVGAVSPELEQQIAHLQGGGSPLPEQERGFFEQRMGADFSQVRIHQTPDMAQALNARAFTVGNNIAFNTNEYAPGSDDGRHLLAHELTHVLQQEDHSAVARTIQRTPITTAGGEWRTETYDVVSLLGMPIGLDIDLRFTPKAPTDASKIGLVQAVNSLDEGKPFMLNATIESHSVPGGEQGAGTHIDRRAPYANPLYAARESNATDTLGDTPTSDGWGHHGWRYTDEHGQPQEEEAQLKDSLKQPGHGANASQIFETTALAVEGNQSGSYYGSVRWGWQTDSEGNFSKLPLSVASNGNPTDVFMRAAQIWNASHTSTGKDTLDLPTIYDPGAAASLSTPDLINALREAKEPQLAAVPATTNKEFQVRQLEHELLRRNITVAVTAVRGSHDPFFAGSDDVYVKLTYGGRSHQTPEHDMAAGNTHSFQIALGSILPGEPLPANFALDGAMTIAVVDSDLIFDDALTSLTWNAPFEPFDHNGGDYTVHVSFA